MAEESDTLCVIAADAADYRLAREWNCSNLLLGHHDSLETYAYTHELPYTPEVWATIATGLSPDEHGIYGDAQAWNNDVLRAAGSVSKYLPMSWRRALGRWVRDTSDTGGGQHFEPSDAPSCFDDGLVEHWPGITEATHLSEAWSLMDAVNSGKHTQDDLISRMYTNTGEELGWLAAAASTSAPIAGVHCHVLDVAGHVYADDENALREVYQWVDDLVGWIREQVDRLVVLSDHGMQTTWLDNDPGNHSWRAFVAADDSVVGNDGLPSSVYDVSAWLSEHKGAGGTAEDRVDMATPTEHLRDLGYLE